MNRQRKGQFIWNYLAESKGFPFDSQSLNILVGTKIWNISDKEFDKILKRWEQQE